MHSLAERRGSGWKARRELRFIHDHGETRLQENQGYGPLGVQRPFQPENGAYHGLSHDPRLIHGK